MASVIEQFSRRRKQQDVPTEKTTQCLKIKVIGFSCVCICYQVDERQRSSPSSKAFHVEVHSSVVI